MQWQKCSVVVFQLSTLLIFIEVFLLFVVLFFIFSLQDFCSVG